MDIEPRGIVEAYEGVVEFGGSAVCLQPDYPLDYGLRVYQREWHHSSNGSSLSSPVKRVSWADGAVREKRPIEDGGQVPGRRCCLLPRLPSRSSEVAAESKREPALSFTSSDVGECLSSGMWTSFKKARFLLSPLNRFLHLFQPKKQHLHLPWWWILGRPLLLTSRLHRRQLRRHLHHKRIRHQPKMMTTRRFPVLAPVPVPVPDPVPAPAPPALERRRRALPKHLSDWGWVYWLFWIVRLRGKDYNVVTRRGFISHPAGSLSTRAIVQQWWPPPVDLLLCSPCGNTTRSNRTFLWFKVLRTKRGVD